MTWAGTAPSGRFWTLNVGGGFAQVDWEEARGDASGLIDDLVVIAIQRNPVSPATPLIGNVLSWDGSRWVPTPAVSVSGAHQLLSLTHLDTVPASPIAGDLVAASGSPAAWARFAIGDQTQRLAVTLSGTLEWKNKFELIIMSSGSVINLGREDTRIIVNKTIGSPTTVNLPINPVLAQEITIKDGKGDAGPPNRNFINVVPATGTIDGLNRIRVSQNYQAYTLMWNGGEWNII